jgi:tyrosinase
MTTLDRRSILKHGAALAAASAVSGSQVFAAPIPIGPPLRRSVGTMAATDPILVSYRAAVTAMKQLTTKDPSDPRGWTKQAQIHNNWCPHNNWYFLPWHRAYLHAFERLCRQLSGNANFALPYWDWTAHPQLPAVFADPASPLFDKTRSSQTVSMPTNNTGTTVIANILNENTFEVFASSRPPAQNNTNASWQRNQTGTLTGPLEGNPHNSVHGRILGNMGGYMSPLDPIFWLHHCNIDRLWDQWNRSGHANTGDARWRNFGFSGNQFVVPSGAGSTPYNPTVSGLLNIGTLGYRYVTSPLVATLRLDMIPRAIDLSKLPPVARLQGVPVAKLNSPLNLPIKLNPQQNAALERIRIEPQTKRRDTKQRVPAPGRIIAFLRDIDPPKNNAVDVRVFVNHPDLKPDTPTDDPHYAGSFAFFGSEHTDHQDAGKPSFMIDLTNTVIRLRQAQPALKDEINVQLMPVPVPGGPREGIDFKLGAVDVAIF